MQNPTFYQGHLKKCGINKAHRKLIKTHMKRTINKLATQVSNNNNNNNKSKNNKNPPKIKKNFVIYKS